MGAPISDVTTPTGSCCGASMVRASVSASTRKLPPASAAAGTSTRWSGPKAKRQACGTIRPTKPMLPALVTALAVSRPEQKNSPLRRAPTRMPSVAAASACSAITFMARALRRANHRPAASTIHGSHRCGAPARSPISQNTMLRRRLSGAIDSMSVTMAMVTDDRITPVSSSRAVPPSAAVPPRRSRRARKYSKSDTATAPAKAAASIIHVAHMNSRAASAPTEAPPEIPST